MSTPLRPLRCAGAGIALLGLSAGALPAVQLGGTMELGAGSASWDLTGAGGPLSRGSAGASFRSGPLLGLEPELAGGAGLSTEASERTAVHWDFGARLHTRGRTAGAWLGASVGGAGIGAPSAAFTRLEGGVRRRFGRAGVTLWLERTSFGSRAQGSATDTLAGRQVAEYVDLGSRATVGLGRYELGVLLLRRLGGAGPPRTGWEASAVWWLAPSIGLVGTAGHSLAQLGTPIPGARYTTLGLRLALGSASPAAGASPRAGAEAGAAPRLLLATPTRLVVAGPPAARAEVMGDFTDWLPRSMSPAGEGRWALPVALSPGAHHLNVRFDGGAWRVPAGAAPVDDGYGGRVGLFVVR